MNKNKESVSVTIDSHKVEQAHREAIRTNRSFSYVINSHLDFEEPTPEELKEVFD